MPCYKLVDDGFAIGSNGCVCVAEFIIASSYILKMLNSAFDGFT